jgi:two-component system CheB/CheR fusion protein
MTIEHKLTGSSILVIEDDPDTLELLAQTFVHLGARVRRARSAEIALAMLAGSRMDAVLCDLQLPDVDGYALLERIRAILRYASSRGRDQRRSPGGRAVARSRGFAHISKRAGST